MEKMWLDFSLSDKNCHSSQGLSSVRKNQVKFSIKSYSNVNKL